MSNTLKQLLAEKVALEQKITEVRAAEMAEAIGKIHALIDEYELKQEDIFARTSSAKSRKTSSAKMPAKYRDPISGASWSGQGRAPKWIVGNKDNYLIA